MLLSRVRTHLRLELSQRSRKPIASAYIRETFREPLGVIGGVSERSIRTLMASARVMFPSGAKLSRSRPCTISAAYIRQMFPQYQSSSSASLKGSSTRIFFRSEDGVRDAHFGIFFFLACVFFYRLFPLLLRKRFLLLWWILLRLFLLLLWWILLRLISSSSVVDSSSAISSSLWWILLRLFLLLLWWILLQPLLPPR